MKLSPSEIKETYFTPYRKYGNNLVPIRDKLFSSIKNIVI